jgi:hypothetical protein
MALATVPLPSFKAIRKINDAAFEGDLRRALKSLANFNISPTVVWAKGTAAGAVQSTVASILYVLNGVWKTKTVTDNISLAPTTTQYDVTGKAVGTQAVPAGSEVYFLISLDASGNVHVTEGDVVTTGSTYLDAQGNTQTKVATLPDCPDDDAAVAAIKVVTDSTHTFTPGTTNTDAAGITTTFTTLSSMPYNL